MKLIVESGATKSTWVVINKDGVLETAVLQGINPTSNPGSVTTVEKFASQYKDKIEAIHFYGAGVSSPVAIELLKSKMKENFNCEVIELEHDILAAARSISSGVESIVSILGTGTNTVVFDGQEIVQSFKALGYFFGDYGSGFHFGKTLLRMYYTKQMSAADEKKFHDKYIADQPDLLFRIYSSARPNFVTADLSRFLEEGSTELREQVTDIAFTSFFENQILPIKNYKDYPLCFVGSISGVFSKELHKAADRYGCKISKISGNPIDGLIAYHQSK